MAAYELLLLNTSIPQIQAAQSGDTYVCPRDIQITANLDVTGNTTLGDASTDTVRVNGYMGVGGAGVAAIGLYVRNNLTTSATTQYGISATVTASSSATSALWAIEGAPATPAESFIVSNIAAFRASNTVKGAGSTITNQHGLYIADQSQGTNNYGITSLVSSGTNKWNIYASGTAANYFAGDVLIGGTSSDSKLTLRTSGSGSNIAATFGTSAGGVWGGLYVNAGSPYPLEWYAGTLKFRTGNSAYASTTERFALLATEAVFNDPGNDYDFRVESDTNTHALFVQGSDGNVGIGTSSPLDRLDVVSSGGTYRNRIRNSTTAEATLLFQNSTTGTTSTDGLFVGIVFGADAYFWQYENASLIFGSNNAERLRIKSTGQTRFVPLAADPAGAEAGDVYYNSGTNKLRLYDGTSWVDLN